MTEQSQSRSDEALKKLRVASAVIGNLPELPGYNGSVKTIDDEEAARIQKDIDYAVAILSERGKLTDWLRDNAPDCGDNSCLFGGRGKGGMRTNGGCRCYKDVRPDMRRIYIERMQAALPERPDSSKEKT